MTEILIENEQEKTEISEETVKAICDVVKKTLEYEECNFDAEVSVTIVDNEEIRKLNNAERGIDRATDVLSFPMLEFDDDGNAIECDFEYTENDLVLLGDIVISAERAAEQAQSYGHSFLREMAFLTVHSMLHLLGYDHVDDPEGEETMIRKQNEILEMLNITRDQRCEKRECKKTCKKL